MRAFFYIIEHKFFRSLLPVIIFLSFSHCSEKLIDVDTLRSVLIYIAADNSLGQSGDDYTNIEQLKRGFIPANGNIVIYHDPWNAPPRLLRLVKRTDTVEEDLIEQYNEEDSTDPSVLTRVLYRMQELFPAKDYGLILWSHSTGWLPKGEFVKYQPYMDKYTPSLNSKQFNATDLPGMQFNAIDLPRIKSFGENRGNVMEIDDLADAIPFRLSFIIFDSCHMGGIEVAYALREKTDNIIASPTEILAEGFPYHLIMQPLFMPLPNYTAVCDAYYNYYNDKFGMERSATIALYKTEGLASLAVTVKAIYEANRAVLDGYVPSIKQLQCYDRLSKSDIFFDLDNFVRDIAIDSDYEHFKSHFKEVVVYKRATANFFYIPIDPERYSGIYTYIPNGFQSTRDAYKITEWNRAVLLIK